MMHGAIIVDKVRHRMHIKERNITFTDNPQQPNPMYDANRPNPEVMPI